jgi:hypothetical protein
MDRVGARDRDGSIAADVAKDLHRLANVDEMAN